MSTSEINKVVCSITNYIVERKRFEKSFASHMFKNYKEFFQSTDRRNPLYGKLTVNIVLTDTEVQISNLDQHTHKIPTKLDHESILEILISNGNFNPTRGIVTYSLKPYDEFSYSRRSDEEYSSPSTIENMLIAIEKARKAELEENFTAQFADFLSTNWRACFSNDHVSLFLRETDRGTRVESEFSCDSAPSFVSDLPVEYIVAILEQTDNVTLSHYYKDETISGVEHYQITYSI
jgi:hypothetical protein